MKTANIGEASGIRFSVAPIEGRWQIVLSMVGVFDTQEEVALYMHEQAKELAGYAQGMYKQLADDRKTAAQPEQSVAA